jgi:hypothetical protein
MSNMVKFETLAGSPDIVFIFLDRISQCQTKWTAELIKNLSDYVLTKINVHGFNVIQGLDEDALLKEAAQDYNYAVVLSTGTEFLNGDEFFHEVEKLVYSHTDFFLMGHIPDRDDGYYELHEQCYIINLNTYEELGFPVVGKFQYYSSHEQVKPIRSKDNVHDDYTPVWIKPGSPWRVHDYKHKWHGWNILSTALKNDKPVLVFGPEFRDNKRYYYPNYEPAFINACTYLYGKNEVAAQTLFYPYNTEILAEVVCKEPIRQLVIQASGLQFVDYLALHGYNENTVVRFVDYNLFALECMEHIVEHWDGNNYLDFVKGYVSARSSFLKNKTQEWITLTGFEQKVNPSVWQDIINTVKFEFAHQDLVLNKGLEVSSWLDNVPNTIVHLSHIFNYDPAAPFVPLRHRIYNEKLLKDKIKKYNPDAYIVLVDEVSEFFKDKLPTWHLNGEWHGI